jgi:hypothetical protein
MKIVFEKNEEAFETIGKARSAATEYGCSYGSMCMDDPIALYKGDCDVSKWRHLSQQDKNEMDGVILGEKRNGPVTLIIFDNDDPNPYKEEEKQ